MFLKLALGILVFHLSISGKMASPSVEVALTVNATSIEVGNSVKLTCKLVNFVPQNEDFFVNFFRDNQINDIFCDYAIPVAHTGRQKMFSPNTILSDLLYQPVSSTFPIYEISLTPRLAGNHTYGCNLFTHQLYPTPTSNAILLTAKVPLSRSSPSVVLSSNVPSVSLNQTFALTCTLSHVESLPGSYSVTFNSQRDGQLAVYDVTKEKEALLSVVKREKVDVSPGKRANSPIFDLQVTEKETTFTAYWCTLERATKAPVLSKLWPVLVHFTASAPGENQRSGTCAIEISVELKGQAYYVQFFSDLGPKSVNLLAEYIIKPDYPKELLSYPLNPWTAIKYGSSTSWPQFSILASGASLHGHWWCQLVIGTQGSPNYGEFQSNKLDL